MSGAISRSTVLGTWELQSYVVVDDTGATIALPLGKNPIGHILYTGDGYMSAQLMRRNRPNFGAASTSGGTVDQTVAAARGYLAYCGPYEIDEATGTFNHHVAVSLLPNSLGGQQVRYGALREGVLTLSGDVSGEFGTTASAMLVWSRPRRFTTAPLP